MPSLSTLETKRMGPVKGPSVKSLDRGKVGQASTRTGTGSDSRRFSGGGATNL